MKYNFSIIIPHYNIPDLLVRMLASIPVRDDVQVIVADDCSPGFGEWRDKVAARFPEMNLEFYQTDRSGSAGRARNVGIDHAQGEWVIFEDADDFFDENVGSILDRCIGRSEDVLYFRTRAVMSDDITKPSPRSVHAYCFDLYHKKKGKHREDALRYYDEPLRGKVIKKSLIDSNGIRCGETYCSNDVMMSRQVGVFAKDIAVFDDVMDVVTERPGSLCRFDAKPLEKALISFGVRVDALRFLRSHGVAQGYKTLAKSQLGLLRYGRKEFRDSFSVLSFKERCGSIARMPRLMLSEMRQKMRKKRISVLYAVTYRRGLPLFIHSTIKEISWMGVTPRFGMSKFWNCRKFPDIVHFEWPEAVYSWKEGKLTEAYFERFRKRLEEFKDNGSVIVLTRHNELPHALKTDLAARLFSLVENEADAVIHMGRFSMEQMAERRDPSSAGKDYLIPHPIFSNLFHPMDRDKARKRLGIGPDEAVVASIGRFRNGWEEETLKDAVASCAVPDIRLLAPSLEGKNKFFSNRKIELTVSASDVVFIQRKDILNSGNLPLGFLFGKVVVGTDYGNIGEILRETGNPTFDHNDPSGAGEALRRGFELARKGKGEENRRYAYENWHPYGVAQMTYYLYRQLIDK